MAEDTSKSEKVVDGFKAVGAVLAAPFMLCAMFYFCFVADKDPWGAPNHPKRDRMRRENMMRKEQEKEEPGLESQHQHEQRGEGKSQSASKAKGKLTEEERR